MSDEQKPEASLFLDEAGQATVRRYFEIMLARAEEPFFGPFFMLGCLEAMASLPRELSERFSRALVAAEERNGERFPDGRRALSRALSREDAERKRAERAEAERNALTDRVANLERGKEVLRGHLNELRALLPKPNENEGEP